MHNKLSNSTLNNLSSSELLENAVFVAFDGYVDKIQRAVKSQGRGTPAFYSTLDEFGQRISAASNQSAQIELYTDEIKLGGNAPIMAECLGSLGITTTCFGTMGFPETHPVFQAMHPNVFRITAGPSAETNALEFGDGKLILSELNVFTRLDWDTISHRIDMEVLKFRLLRSPMIALVGWCNLPHATDIWRGILSTLEQLNISQPLSFFFDLADPSKKSREDVFEVVQLMQAFTQKGKTTLGLNENEAHILVRLLGGDESETLEKKARFLWNSIRVTELVIHPTDRAIFINESGIIQARGKVIKRPKVSTGGGDNFNAGYCLATFLNCNPEERLIVAMASSGYYVREGVSPSRAELLAFIQED